MASNGKKMGRYMHPRLISRRPRRRHRAHLAEGSPPQSSSLSLMDDTTWPMIALGAAAAAVLYISKLLQSHSEKDAQIAALKADNAAAKGVFHWHPKVCRRFAPAPLPFAHAPSATTKHAHARPLARHLISSHALHATSSHLTRVWLLSRQFGDRRARRTGASCVNTVCK